MKFIIKINEKLNDPKLSKTKTEEVKNIIRRLIINRFNVKEIDDSDEAETMYDDLISFTEYLGKDLYPDTKKFTEFNNVKHMLKTQKNIYMENHKDVLEIIEITVKEDEELDE